jgi:sugar/nucleoside kinase (ribokinase family)
MPRVGVIGSLVWDQIHGWERHSPPMEEWGGIAYALAGLDAALPADWEIVPLIKVGDDLASQADQFLRSLSRVDKRIRCVTVPTANNRVTLRYQDEERRCERMSGGVPGWSWPELGPMVSGLDALYINFISGIELSLGTAEALRHGFDGPVYADLHSLLLGIEPDGTRALQPLHNTADWFNCFDMIQLNEDEMRQISGDPLELAASAMASGVSLLNVTLGSRGVAYVARPGFERIATPENGMGPHADSTTPLRTELIAAPTIDALDPTGCGDVFGATCFANLLKGLSVRDCLLEANSAAARNATFRGATGLVRHLDGHLLELS